MLNTGIEGLVNVTEIQTEQLATKLCEEIVGMRLDPSDVVEVPAGVLLNLIGRVGASEMAINDLWSRINGADLPDYR